MLVFPCTTKNNEALIIQNRKIESWEPHVTIIIHVALFERTP